MNPNYNYGHPGGGYQQNMGQSGGVPHGNYPPGAYQGGYQNPGAYQNQSGYSNAGYGPPPSQQWFQLVDKDRSGKINAQELQMALVNGQGKNFSETVCRVMIDMFDKEKTGLIDMVGFDALYNYINQWLNIFRKYDKDASGYIDEYELAAVFNEMGFRLSDNIIKSLVLKYDPENRSRVSVDQFVLCCIQLQRFTEAFRVRDTESRGVITINFEDFLGLALNF